MANNKVQLADGTVLMDTTGVTVTADTLLAGRTALDARGVLITGTFEPYPVGAIYMSTDQTSPAALFGGTWTSIEDRFLVAAGTTYSQGDTGGSATIDLSHTHTTAGHSLTKEEMPGHTHTANYNVVQSSSGTARSVRNLVVSGTGGTTETNSTGSGWSHSHGDTGSALSASQSILPPYLAVYMWKRTA